MSGYQIIPYSSAPAVPFKFDGRVLFTSPGYELVHLTLTPGEAMDPHTQPFPVLFFVAEGTGTLTIGDNTLVIGEKTTIHVEKEVLRAWSNNSNGPLRILVGKLISS